MSTPIQNPTQLEEPISVIITAGNTQTISFPQQFFGFGTSIIITNNDAANAATYQINGETQPTLNLAAGAFRSLNSVKLSLLIITAGAVGSVQVQAVRNPLAGQ
jgi:hypothetical protein